MKKYSIDKQKFDMAEIAAGVGMIAPGVGVGGMIAAGVGMIAAGEGV